MVAAAGDRWSEPVGIIATDDGGETWQLRQPGLFLGNADTRNAGPILARSPDDPDLIYAAGVGANFVSRDGGATWEPFGPTGLHATSLAVDRSNPDRLWLAATAAEIQVTHLGGKTKFDGGWFVSDDGGATFRKVADEAPREFAQSHDDPGVLLGLFGINDVRRSDDGGRTWSDLTAGLPLDGTGGFNDWSRTSSALTAAPGRAVLVTRDGTVFELPTGAAEWRRVGPESVDGRGWYGNLGRRPGWVHFGKAAGDVLVDPHDPSRWFFTDWYALWRSDDAGRTWAFAADGLEATVIHAIAATPGDGAHVHLGMADNGYLLSTDGGATFTNVEGLPVGDSNAKAIAVSPADPQRVYLTGNTKAGAWESTGLGVSADGGQTWSAAPAEGLPDMAGRMMCSVAVDPTGATSIAVGVSGKVGDGGGAYLSDDGGATFRLVADGLPTGGGYFRNDVWVCGREIAIGPGGGTVAFSHDRKLVHRLAPGASAWEAAGLEPAGKPNDVVADSANPGRFYLAVGGDGLYRSDDGGATFSQVWQGRRPPRRRLARRPPRRRGRRVRRGRGVQRRRRGDVQGPRRRAAQPRPPGGRLRRRRLRPGARRHERQRHLLPAADRRRRRRRAGPTSPTAPRPSGRRSTRARPRAAARARRRPTTPSSRTATWRRSTAGASPTPAAANSRSTATPTPATRPRRRCGSPAPAAPPTAPPRSACPTTSGR